MYDEYARNLINQIPELPEIDREQCRRALSAAYFHIIRTRLGTRENNASQLDRGNILSVLRRLGDSLESIAVFDPLNGQIRDRGIENACSFVAAEALSLHSALLGTSEETNQEFDPLRNPSIYVAIESALLYMIGGYDIDALSVVREISTPIEFASLPVTLAGTVLNNSKYVLTRILALCRGDVRRLYLTPLSRPQSEQNKVDQTKVLHSQFSRARRAR